MVIWHISGDCIALSLMSMMMTWIRPCVLHLMKDLEKVFNMSLEHFTYLMVNLNVVVVLFFKGINFTFL